MWNDVTIDEEEYADAHFTTIPLPPDDGKEFAFVWVEVQRDEQGKRTCVGFLLLPCCQEDSDVLTPGPDCPLGSDEKEA